MPGEAASNNEGTRGDHVVLQMDAETLARRLHDLRNGLNSLLMNAAVLAAKLPPADRDGRFARQVQADGERCAALLQALTDAAHPPGGATAR